MESSQAAWYAETYKESYFIRNSDNRLLFQRGDVTKTFGDKALFAYVDSDHPMGKETGVDDLLRLDILEFRRASKLQIVKVLSD